MDEKTWTTIKSIISDCICKSVVFVKAKIPETPLNLLANEYADKLAQAILSAGWVKMSIHAEPPKRKRIEPLGETVHKHIVEKEYQEALTLMKFKQDELIDAHNEREEL